jgi:hypothetical protein
MSTVGTYWVGFENFRDMQLMQVGLQACPRMQVLGSRWVTCEWVTCDLSSSQNSELSHEYTGTEDSCQVDRPPF